jgi:hypothetical protein
LSLDRDLVPWIQDALGDPRLELLPLTPAVVVTAHQLRGALDGDPGNRLIVATAMLEGAKLVSKDARITESGIVPVPWGFSAPQRIRTSDLRLRRAWRSRRILRERGSPDPIILANEMASDTKDAALAAQVAASRQLGARERLRMAVEMSEDARRISVEGELRRHPDLSEEEARHRVFRRLWGPDLASRVVTSPTSGR